MKIAVAKLQANPFRKMTQYPIDRAKIKALKTSINETSFWDNILARPKNGKFQIAYGHHRWIAIKELGLKQVDIPVRDLSDAMMVKIMAEENLGWTTTPAVINETVLTTKEFLDGELGKAESLECLDKSIKALFLGKKGDFKHCKKNGVGRTIIRKFLGKNWKEWMIVEALKILDSEKKGLIDREAIESVGTIDRASHFLKSVEDYKVPKGKQRQIAEKIRTQKIPSKRIPLIVRQASMKQPENDPAMESIGRLIKGIDEQARSLMNKIMLLRRNMAALDIEQIRGIRVWLAASSLKMLFKELNRLKSKESEDEITDRDDG